MTSIKKGIPAKLTLIDLSTSEAVAVSLQSENNYILQLNKCLERPEDIKENDIILIDEDCWGKHPYPPSGMITNSNIYYVVNILDDYILVEDANKVRKWFQVYNTEIQIGDYIKYDPITCQITHLTKESYDIITDPDMTPYLFKPTNELHFKDFYGYRTLVNRIKNFFDTNLRRRDLLEKFNTHPAKGILFTGDPGMGKTFLGRIIASEFNIPFYLINGPSIISKWVGDSENTLHNIFNTAGQSKNGSIIFIDEIDAIAPTRTSSSFQHDTRLVEQLLTEMDGFDSSNNVIVIASTNRVDSIDPALKRPGRFDRIEIFPLPSFDDRLDILTKKSNVAPHQRLSIKEIAYQTEGFSPSELCAIFTEAIQLAVHQEREEISNFDFIQGYNIVAKNHRQNRR